MSPAVNIFGLTGGIACGKSTVAGFLRDAGVGMVDADLAAREVVKPGSEGLAEIVRVFGAELLTQDGALDRKKMGERVFRDPDARRRLEAITHPLIRDASMSRARQLAEAGHALIGYEAALLVEAGTADAFRPLVVVVADERDQLARLRARDGFDEAQAKARLAAQMPVRQKAALADHVIDTSCPLDEVRVRTLAVLRRLREHFGLPAAG